MAPHLAIPASVSLVSRRLSLRKVLVSVAAMVHRVPAVVDFTTSQARMFPAPLQRASRWATPRLYSRPALEEQEDMPTVTKRDIVERIVAQTGQARATVKE